MVKYKFSVLLPVRLPPEAVRELKAAVETWLKQHEEECRAEVEVKVRKVRKQEGET
ncbi:MAG: hypothetical protein LM577_07120 [Thermoproteaceae archaeon]|nr:hypothetical protein [Thermoproteaceae archaeon]